MLQVATLLRHFASLRRWGLLDVVLYLDDVVSPLNDLRIFVGDEELLQKQYSVWRMIRYATLTDSQRGNGESVGFAVLISFQQL